MLDLKLDRRTFLKLGSLSILAYSNAFAKSGVRSLGFQSLHTGERWNSVYWENGQYIPESLAGINRVLRDHRTNEVTDIAPRLLDTLWELRTVLETEKPFELISGYRSPATNAKLRNEGRGVATTSLHMKGMAADIRVPGKDLARLRDAALSLKAGGVGYYPSQFVHVDVGRVRRW